jgi:hypothetical protein
VSGGASCTGVVGPHGELQWHVVSVDSETRQVAGSWAGAWETVQSGGGFVCFPFVQTGRARYHGNGQWLMVPRGVVVGRRTREGGVT